MFVLCVNDFHIIRIIRAEPFIEIKKHKVLYGLVN